MAILKAAEGPHTLTVTGIEEVTGQYGAQWRFTADTGDVLFLGDMAAARQVARLGLTMDGCIGKTLTFSQTQKDGKTYNNIALAGNGAPAASGAPKAAAAPAPRPAPRMTPEEAAAVYGRCVDLAMATLGSKLEQAQVPFDGAVIQSAAATIFIACK